MTIKKVVRIVLLVIGAYLVFIGGTHLYYFLTGEHWVAEKTSGERIVINTGTMCTLDEALERLGDEPQSGKFERFTQVGRRKLHESHYENGRPVGVTREWYRSGVLASSCSYSNGVPHGEWVFYYPSGAMRGRGLYAFGEEVESTGWYENGRLKARTIMHPHSTCVKHMQRWDEQGQIMEDAWFDEKQNPIPEPPSQEYAP